MVDASVTVAVVVACAVPEGMVRVPGRLQDSVGGAPVAGVQARVKAVSLVAAAGRVRVTVEVALGEIVLAASVTRVAERSKLSGTPPPTVKVSEAEARV